MSNLKCHCFEVPTGKRELMLELKKRGPYGLFIYTSIYYLLLQSKLWVFFFDMSFVYDLWCIILSHIWKKTLVPQSCLIFIWTMQIQITALRITTQLPLNLFTLKCFLPKINNPFKISFPGSVQRQTYFSSPSSKPLSSEFVHRHT